MKNSPDEGPTLSDALERTVSSLVDVVDKRIELAQLDARAFVSRLAQATAFFVGGVFFAALGWTALMGLAYVTLAEARSPALAVGAICALNAVLGIALLLFGRRFLSPPKRT